MVSPLAEDPRGDSQRRLSHSDAQFDNDSTAHHPFYEASIEKLRLHWFSEGIRLGRQLQHDEDDGRLSRYKTRIRAQRTKCEEEVLLRKRYRKEMEFLQSEVLVLKDQLLAAHIAYEELALSVTTPSFNSHSGRLESSSAPERHDFVNESFIGSAPPDAEEDFYAFQQMQYMGHDILPVQLVDDADQSRFPVELEDLDLSASPCSNPESPPSNLSDLSEPDAHSHQPPCKADDEGQDASGIASLMSAAHKGDSIALQKVRTLIRVAERTPKWQRTPGQAYLLVYWRSPKSPVTAALPSPDALEIYVDASGSGIGFIFNSRWLAWKFVPAHPLLPLGLDGQLVISWAELVAVEMGIRTLIAAGIRDVIVIVHSDNQGVVVALKSGKWTPKYDLNEIVERILRLSCKAGLSLKMKWIPTKENPADNPSRGVYPPTELSFYCRPTIPRTLSELIQDVE